MWKTGISEQGLARIAQIQDKDDVQEADWYGPDGEKFEPSSTQKQVYEALLAAAERISQSEYASQIKQKGKRPKQLIPSAEAETLLEAAQEVMAGTMDPEEAMNLLYVPEVFKKRVS